MAKKKKKQQAQKQQQKTSVPNQAQTAEVLENGRILPDHPSNKITPAKLKSIFEDAEAGNISEQHLLFMDIEEQDSSVAANIQTRKRAALTMDWRIMPPRNATPAEEQLTEQVDYLFYQFGNIEDLIVDCMDAVAHGFSALEIEWQFNENQWQPKCFHHRPPSWFKLDKFDNLLLMTPNNREGEPLQPFGWVVHRHKSRSVQLARNGLFRTLAWLYMFKYYSVHDFAEFLELYGMPIRLGKYPAGSTAEERRTLLRALAAIGHNASGIMPEGMNVELHNAASGTTTGNNPFLQMIDWCEKSIARLILGQTLTSGADGKSSTNALGNVHNEVRRDLLVSDVKQLAQTFTQQIILPYLQINYPNINPNRIPVFEFDTKEREDVATYADALPKLVDIGLQVPTAWVYDKLGIPEPDKDEAVLKRLSTDIKNDLNEGAEPKKTLEKNAALSLNIAGHSHSCACGCHKNQENQENQVETQAALKAEPGTKSPQQALDDELENAFTQIDFNQQLDPMLQQAVAALQACNDYEEAFAALAQLYPDLDTQTHQRYLTNALFLSELLGA